MYKTFSDILSVTRLSKHPVFHDLCAATSPVKELRGTGITHGIAKGHPSPYER